MAQFDVYPNPSPRSRDQVPYVVDVQSNLLSALRTRLVMPLTRVAVDSPHPPRRLAPQFTITGERLALQPQAAAGLDARLANCLRVNACEAEGGAPIGVQIAGRRGDDWRVLDVGARLEDLLNPPL